MSSPTSRLLNASYWLVMPHRLPPQQRMQVGICGEKCGREAEYRRQKEEERVVHLPEQWTRMDHYQYKHEQVAAEAHS